MFNWGAIHGVAADAPRTETAKMTDHSRLHAYLHGEAKYHVLPVPTPLDRLPALTFVAEQLPTTRSAEEMGKLGRIASFYDLRETADAFLSAAKAAKEDIPRAAAAIGAVAWEGNAEEFAEAQKEFSALLRRADVEQDRNILFETSFALGPRVGSEPLKQAIAGAVNDLRARLRTKSDPMLENRVARLEEFTGLELAELDQANKLRTTLEALPEDARRPRLVELYLDDSPDSTPRLAAWAGLKLLRSPVRQTVAPEFLAQAAKYNRRDADRQAELDIVRARALRAAEYFGARLPDADRTWLASQKDMGTDLLALRPNWEYPAPHAHGPVEPDEG
jgi:hypothetical protein